MGNEQKKNRAFNIIVNIIVVLVVVFVALIAISKVTSYKKGYNSIFGTAYIAVETNSMAGKEKDNFSRGALIFVDVFETYDESKGLERGDIITFKHYDESLKKTMILTHRIIRKEEFGTTFKYFTQGDNNKQGGEEMVLVAEIIGRYKGHVPLIGNLSLFFYSKWGFFTAVIIPCFLLVLYCGYKVFISVKVFKAEKAAIQVESLSDEEKIRHLEEQLAKLKQTESESPPKDAPPDHPVR